MSPLLHELAARSAERTPTATAVVMGDRRMTYEQLVGGARRLARHLRDEHGVRPGDRVALMSPKSPTAVLGMLAVLEAGAAYVPIDTSGPVARSGHVLAAAQPRAVLVGAGATTAVSELARLGALQDAAVVALDEGDDGHPPAWPLGSDAPLGLHLGEDDLAHLLFTSGSTGVPKGVQITHRNVTSFLDWALPHFSTAAGERISGHPPLHFDLSTFDVHGTLAAGAELHLVPPEASAHPARLAEFIRSSEVVQWFSVPSTMAYLTRAAVVRQDDFPALRRVLFCGEPMPVGVLRAWMTRLPHVRFTNLYGPTEATIASTWFTVPEVPAAGCSAVPIGSACTGEQVHVLDDDLRPVVPGETGQVAIAGSGVSPGYWQDAERTAAAFVVLPEPLGGRAYLTGDLARHDGDGALVFVGRRDAQVKHRGYRIELGEVEAALLSLPQVAEAVVTAVPSDGFAGNELCCAYVPVGALTPFDLRSALAELLPTYMLPTRWRRYDALPRNGNDKTDRRAVHEAMAADRVLAVSRA